jgi:AraC-like DNA-binding protein
MIHPAWLEENKSFLTALSHEKKRTLYFTGYDNSALNLLHLMNHLGIKPPQDAGILGRGNTTSSKISDPGISTIKWPWIGLANAAIEMLEQKKGDRRIPSGEVVIRESSVQASEYEHQWVFKIADIIESYGHEGLSVDQLAQHVKVSKSTLERRYSAIYGMTPSAAIRKAQLKKAEQLLRDGDMTIEGVAYSAGFKSVRTFFRAFESVYKISPAIWKNKHST